MLKTVKHCKSKRYQRVRVFVNVVSGELSIVNCKL